MQVDNRLFFNDGGGVLNNSFVLRRARLIFEGALNKNYSFQLVLWSRWRRERDGRHAGFDLRCEPWRRTHQRCSSSLASSSRRWVSSSCRRKRRLLSANAPSSPISKAQPRPGRPCTRAISLGGTLNYGAANLDGVPDGPNSGNDDVDKAQDAVGRVVVAPFKYVAESPFQGLWFGVSASLGRQKGATGRTAGYKTDGQQTFFSYAATTIADGQSWRVSPQLDYRYGPLGVMSEYVVSTVNVRPSATGAKTELRNRAWQVSAGYVLTGENSSFYGITPHDNFDFAHGTWGAFELTARYSDLRIDDNAFPLFASAATNADEASAVGVGLNWYLSRAVAFKIDYFQTKFGFNSEAPLVSATQILRQDEKAFITRFQVSF